MIVSNRLPVRLEVGPQGGLRPRPAGGGLVTALGPLVRRRGGLWIGWPGVARDDRRFGARDYGEAVADLRARAGFAIAPVELSRRDLAEYYHGFCNGVLWPLLHGLAPSDALSEAAWQRYVAVNERFADVVAAVIRPADEILVNDYHLLLLPRLLRRRGLRNRITCFLHTPFPPGELFERLPWAREICLGLTEAHRVGFQTRRDHENFASLVERHSRLGHRSGVYPISVDVAEFEDPASGAAVRRRAALIQAEMKVPHLVLGVDRLDHTKGLLQKLAGFEILLDTNPHLRRRICLTQLVVPSREGARAYRNLRRRLERRIAEINGRFSCRGWVPIHYQYGQWPREELIAQYQAADVALVTPVRDGMNLVAKEYCVCQADTHPGVLVLSRFAGAADQLDDALLVHPHSAPDIARALAAAVTMPQEERRRRMRAMVESIRRWDVYEWSRLLLGGPVPAAPLRVRPSVPAPTAPAARRGCGCG
ncbi:MAG: trehalose-6-phosphate synthase [Gemmatimonadales bacterium]